MSTKNTKEARNELAASIEDMEAALARFERARSGVDTGWNMSLSFAVSNFRGGLRDAREGLDRVEVEE